MKYPSSVDAAGFAEFEEILDWIVANCRYSVYGPCYLVGIQPQRSWIKIRDMKSRDGLRGEALAVMFYMEIRFGSQRDFLLYRLRWK